MIPCLKSVMFIGTNTTSFKLTKHCPLPTVQDWLWRLYYSENYASWVRIRSKYNIQTITREYLSRLSTIRHADIAISPAFQAYKAKKCCHSTLFRFQETRGSLPVQGQPIIICSKASIERLIPWKALLFSSVTRLLGHASCSIFVYLVVVLVAFKFGLRSSPSQIFELPVARHLIQIEPA